MRARRHRPKKATKFPPGSIDPKNSLFGKTRPTVQAAADARAALHDLTLNAQLGEFEAAWELVAVASEISRDIFQLSKPESRLAAFQSIAPLWDAWPGLFYAHKEHRSKMEHHVFKTLRLAINHGINDKGGFSFERRTNSIAFNLYLRLNARRKAGEIRLPLFCRAASKYWWQAGRKEFIADCGHEHDGDFTKHPAFDLYWKVARAADARRVRRDNATASKDYELRDVVRKSILKDMEQSFQTIAKCVDYKALIESRWGEVRAAS